MFHVKPDPNREADEVSRETRSRLDAFVALLRRWNSTVNLVAAGDLDRIWPRHIQDSLQLLPHLPAAGLFLDLGSGGGFPGLVLAIASGKPFHLIEADQRKAAFLREAARETGAPAQIHACRIENSGLSGAALITSRAFAPLPRLLAVAAPLLAPDGMCLLLKGAGCGQELADAQRSWRMRVRQWPSRTAPDGVVLELASLSPCVGQTAARIA